jgi:succinate dehydrogenase / fumarate reductase flavoprotein subunit
VRHKGLGIGGKDAVYLDIVNPDRDVSQGRGPDEIAHRVEGVVEIYEKFIGDDPRQVPMKVFPAVHYSMGGLWCDYEATADGVVDPKSPRNHMTSVSGLYAIGECEYQYHGANRLGANALLSCIYAGKVGGLAATVYAKSLKTLASDAPSRVFDDAKARWVDRFASIGARSSGSENPYDLHTELGDVMSREVTIVRDNARLARTVETVRSLKDRWKSTRVDDATGWANYPLAFVNQLWNMLVLAEIVTLGALARNESRGAHYKPEFPRRDDASWLKTTVVRHDEKAPVLTYDPVDISQIPPVERRYD